jgi:hypothetical protein
MHLCERFTLFSLKFGLLEEGLINIPKNAFKK